MHAQGDHVLVIGGHPFPTFDVQDVSPWPGGGVLRGFPMDLVAGTVDAYDLLCYVHALPPEGVTAYFDALNAGFRVSSSAGSDATLSTAQSFPAGGYRVYVSPASGTPPATPDEAFEGWVDALAAGRSFVTNYPLITSFEVEGVEPGGTVPDGAGKLTGSVSAVCIDPLTKVEIIGNGSVLLEILPAGDQRSVSGTFQVDRAAVKWIVARVTGLASGWHVIPAAGLFAQTGPVYIEDGGPPGGADPDIVPLRDSVNRLIDLMEDVDNFFSTGGYFPDSSEAAYEAASTATLDSLARIYPDPPEPFELVSPLWVSLPHGMPAVLTGTPTFVWCGTFDPDPGDGVTYTFAIDTQPGLTSPTLTSGLVDTTYTIPESEALQEGQVYYWQVRAIDQTGLVTVGTPEEANFIVDMTAAAVAAEPSPSRWALSAAWPNPFNPSLQISYAVPSGGGRFALDVYNARGKLVRSLFLGRRGAGAYVTTWDGRNDAGARVTSGVYFVRLRPADGAVVVRKVVLLK